VNNRKPGCNEAGYFYGGIPPKGSDAGFNRQEDFAESVAAYVFPITAQAEVERLYRHTIYEALLYYGDYKKTARYQYVDNLLGR
jgi:hypothetical protein